MATQSTLTFFSYAREDAKFALRLAEDLRTAGAKLWVDQFDIEPAERWDRAVEDALEGCPRLLVVLSPASVASIEVMDEVSHALNERKPVIPVLHRECKIPYRLHRLQHVDLTLDHESGFKRLLEALEVAKGAEEIDSATPTAPARAITSRSTEQIDLRLPRKRWNEWIGSLMGRFKMLRGLAVVLVGLALYGSWRSIRSESKPGNNNMVVTCEPACKAGTGFVLSVSNTGSTNLPAGAPGIARLGVLLPEPTTLEEWELTSDGNAPIASGFGVPHYGSGNLFSHIVYPANDSLDFSTFQAVSATVGVKVSSYNARAFSLGSFNTPGALITPIKSSKFSGASGFPPGTIFFAFLSNSNDNMRVVNHTPSTALVVVRGATEAHQADEGPLTHFVFYNGNNAKKESWWTRRDDRTWLEHYQDGSYAVLTLVGNTKVDGLSGTLWQKKNLPEQVFLPDASSGSTTMKWRSAENQKWVDTGDIRNEGTRLVPPGLERSHFVFYNGNYAKNESWWTRRDDRTWLEHYQDGSYMVVTLVGNTKVDGLSGTLWQKKNLPEQVFLPDASSGSATMKWRSAENQKWVDTGDMLVDD